MRIVLFMAGLSAANAAMSLLNDNGEITSVAFDNIVPLYAYFGVQHFNDTAKVHVASKNEIELFCNLKSIDEIASIFDFHSDENTLLIIQQSLNFGGLDCDWNFRVNAGTFIRYWCSINASVLSVNVLGGDYPGIFGNIIYANDDLRDMIDIKNSCNLFETRIESVDDEIFIKTLQSKTIVHMSSNESIVENVSRMFIVQCIFRVFLAGFGYYAVACLSIAFLVFRLRIGKLNSFQRDVLCLNMIPCIILGTVLALGNYELDTNISRGVGNFVYNPLTGCSMAGDIFLSLMYSSIDRNTGFNSNTSKRIYRVLVFSAYVAIFADISLGLVVAFGKKTLRNKITLPLSILIVLGQIATSVFQVYQTQVVVKRLSLSNAGSQNQGLISLEGKLRSCVKFSVISSTLIVLTLLYHAYSGPPNHSVVEKLVFWFVLNSSRIGASAAQTYSCSPILVDRRVYTKNAAATKASSVLSVLSSKD